MSWEVVRLCWPFRREVCRAAQEALRDGVTAPRELPGPAALLRKDWKSPPETAAARVGWAGLGHPCLVPHGAREDTRQISSAAESNREGSAAVPVPGAMPVVPGLPPVLQGRGLAISSCCRNVGPTPAPSRGEISTWCPAELARVSG